MVKTFTELSDRLIPSQRWRKINGYVEDHIYGGKWNEYKSDSDNK